MTVITVFVNGKEHQLVGGISIERVVADFVPDAVVVSDDKKSRGVAVAVNESVVPRGAWSATRIQAGDHLEILKAVQGG